MSTTSPETLTAGAPEGQRTSSWLPRIVFIALLAIGLIIIFVAPTKLVAGVGVLCLMIILIFMNIPIAIALAVPSVIGIFAVVGPTAAINLMSTSPMTAIASWSLSVLPMFIFMGTLLTQSGMATRIYRFTGVWLNWLPGGAAIGTAAAGGGLSSVSGSTIAMTYTLGRAGIPEMLKAGYDKRVAIGSVMMAGLPGALIPPSILLVIYAGIASVPVGPQLMAGVLPGVLLVATAMIVLLLMALLRPGLFGRGSAAAAADLPPVTWGERFRALRDIWGLPVIMIVLFGGIFSGVFTPTEAGAGAALISMLLCLWYTRKTGMFRQVAQAAITAVASTASIFFILIGAELLTRMLSVTGLAQALVALITDMNLPRVGFLLMLIVLFLIMGMFFDTLAMMLLTVPILIPTLNAMDINLLWFGVFVVLLAELGMLTPPVGMLGYIVHRLVQDPAVSLGRKISVGNVFMSLAWFLWIPLLFLVIMIFFPEMATWIPGMM